jgi:hypothetical protein
VSVDSTENAGCSLEQCLDDFLCDNELHFDRRMSMRIVFPDRSILKGDIVFGEAERARSIVSQFERTGIRELVPHRA